MTEATAAKVTVLPSANGRPVRRAHKARFLAMLDIAMAHIPGPDAVLIYTGEDGVTRWTPTVGTPDAHVFGLLTYALTAMGEADE